MDQTLLLDSMALLDSYVTRAHQRRQTGALIDEMLLQEAEAMLRRLETLAFTQGQLSSKNHK
jgi:hypothetical protein